MPQPAPSQPDRLPWLTEVPRMAPPPPKRARAPFPWLALLAGFAFLVVAGAAYWFGTRQGTSSDQGNGVVQTQPFDQPFDVAVPPQSEAQIDEQAEPVSEKMVISSFWELLSR